MRTGIIRHRYHVKAEHLAELEGFDFVFLAIDDAPARKVILEGLVALKVPFIDVGLDIAMDAKSRLRGMCRVTVGAPDVHGHIHEVVSFVAPPEDDLCLTSHTEPRDERAAGVPGERSPATIVETSRPPFGTMKAPCTRARKATRVPPHL